MQRYSLGSYVDSQKPYCFVCCTPAVLHPIQLCFILFNGFDVVGLTLGSEMSYAVLWHYSAACYYNWWGLIEKVRLY